MYLDLKEKYWWYELKRDVAEYVVICDACQRVKAEHQRPAGLLQPMKIPEWKWEEVGMDFIVGLPCTQRRYDSIWVIVDRLTKVAHFIPVRLLIMDRSWPNFIWKRYCASMEFLRKLCLIRVLNSRLTFGNKYIVRWEQS